MTGRAMLNWGYCVATLVSIYSSFVLRPRETYWQIYCQTLHPIERFMPTLCSISKNHFRALLHYRKPSQWVCYRLQNTPPSSNLCVMFLQATPITIQPTLCSTTPYALRVTSSGLRLFLTMTPDMFLYREPLQVNSHHSLQFMVKANQWKSLSTAPPRVRKGLASTQIFWRLLVPNWVRWASPKSTLQHKAQTTKSSERGFETGSTT